jgi:hypothetical protein
MFEIFDRVYCVHLPNAERRKAIEVELARIGFGECRFVWADKPPKGFTISNMRRNPGAEFGCALSHIKAIMHAVADGARAPLFIEDDVVFGEMPEIKLPPDWRVLYLGGHPREKVTRAGPNLVKVGRFSCAEAYAIREPMRFLDFWFDRTTQPNAMFDFVLGEYAAGGESFCVYPTVTHQPPNWSSIGEKMDDKRALIARGWAANLA